MSKSSDKSYDKNFLTKMLQGEQLSAIVFVQDYLQLQFDPDRIFTIYLWPTLLIDSKDYEASDRDYKNYFCTFIGSKVDSIKETENMELVFSFQNTANQIKLNINPDNPEIVSEIAHYHDDDAWLIFD